MNEANLGASSREFFNEKGLLRILAGRAIWRIAEDDRYLTLRDQVAEMLKLRTHQCRTLSETKRTSFLRTEE